MNKLLLMLISIFSFHAFSQETVHFNMHYKPETKYIGEVNLSMEITTIHSGSNSYMSYFRETGIDSISKVNELTKAKIELKVLSKDDQGNTPVEMTYLSLETNGIENALVSGLTALGFIEGSKLPVLVSLINSKFDSNFENQFLLTLNQMFEQITFPNVNIAVGESFEETMPFVMRIENLEMSMDLNSKYHLKEIKDKRAFFELIQFGEISFIEDGKNCTGDFKGSGYIYYDMEYEIINETKLDYSFETNYFSNYNNLQLLLNVENHQKFDINKL